MQRLSRMLAGMLLAAPVPVCGQLVALRGPAASLPVAAGSVSGSVTCADTNAPARFAVVTLQPVPSGKGVAEGKRAESMNATATTDMEGRFNLAKVPAGRYFVVGSLPGYVNPLAQFSSQQLQAMSDETRSELAKAVPVIGVEANQTASVSLRLEHAAEMSGTVLYDDGSPAVGLKVQLMRKSENGKLAEIPPGAINGEALFGSGATTDDRGHYRIYGVPPGEFTVKVSLPTQKVSMGLMFSGSTSFTVVGGQGSGLDIYLGNTYRQKEAKLIKVAEGDQEGGLDITIAAEGLHTLKGTVVAKRDEHPLPQGHVDLLYADDRALLQSVEVHDEDGSFEFAYVPGGQYLVRLSKAADLQKSEHHEFNSNWTEEKIVREYGDAEIPVIVQDSVDGITVEAPEIASSKPPTQ